jgi:hypothetical protein
VWRTVRGLAHFLPGGGTGDIHDNFASLDPVTENESPRGGLNAL